jgi:hypothetical protein
MYLLHERYDLKKQGRARQLCPVLSLGSSATCWPCRSRRPRERYVFKNEAEPGSSAPFVVGSSAPCWPCRSCRPRLHAFVSLVSMPSFPSSPRPRLPRLHVLTLSPSSTISIILDYRRRPSCWLPMGGTVSDWWCGLSMDGMGCRWTVRVVDGFVGRRWVVVRRYSSSLGCTLVVFVVVGTYYRRWAHENPPQLLRRATSLWRGESCGLGGFLFSFGPIRRPWVITVPTCRLLGS